MPQIPALAFAGDSLFDKGSSGILSRVMGAKALRATECLGLFNELYIFLFISNTFRLLYPDP